MPCVAINTSPPSRDPLIKHAGIATISPTSCSPTSISPCCYVSSPQRDSFWRFLFLSGPGQHGQFILPALASPHVWTTGVYLACQWSNIIQSPYTRIPAMIGHIPSDYVSVPFLCLSLPNSLLISCCILVENPSFIGFLYNNIVSESKNMVFMS
jgi:hypothetical protein